MSEQGGGGWIGSRHYIDNGNQQSLAKEPIEGPTLTRGDLQTPVIGCKSTMSEKIEGLSNMASGPGCHRRSAESLITLVLIDVDRPDS